MLCRRLLLYCAVFCIYLPAVYRVKALQLHHEEGETDIGQHFERDTLETPAQDVQSTANNSLHQGNGVLAGSGQETEMTSHLWQNKTVYYTFARDLGFNYRATIAEAMNEWSAHTCIQFKVATKGQDRILFVSDDQLGCSSYVGRTGGVQVVSVSGNCLSKGEVMHLIGHVIGLWNEHARPDRDEFIKVLYENIIETEQDNFGRLTTEKFNLVPDVGYDVESIMHFGPFTFSKNNKRTIRLRDDAPLSYKHCTNLLAMGQRNELSYLDKLRANKLYSCQEHITALENAGRECTVVPSIPTTPSQPIRCPLASSTQLFPLTSLQRLKSGSAVTLQFRNRSRGIRCSPQCRPKPCQIVESQSSCHEITYQFELVTVGSDTNIIKAGSKVALRSRCNPTKWLDCSGLSSECSITRCNQCRGDICTYNDYDAPCNRHYFKIFGIGRRNGRMLNSNRQIYLRHDETDSILTCEGETCNLSSEGPSEEMAQIFSITVLR